MPVGAVGHKQSLSIVSLQIALEAFFQTTLIRAIRSTNQARSSSLTATSAHRLPNLRWKSAFMADEQL